MVFGQKLSPAKSQLHGEGDAGVATGTAYLACERKCGSDYRALDKGQAT